MPRAARIVIPGILHHITQRGNRREHVFFDDEDRIYFLDRLGFYAEQAGLKLALHCLMDNHTHLLGVPENGESLKKTLKPLHMCYSQYLNKKFNRSGINWQGRYFSSPLDEKHSWRAFQYVALNPVKAGMTANFESYRWSSASSLLAKTRNSLLTANSEWLELGHRALNEISEGTKFKPDIEAFDRLRHGIVRNLPVGSDDFISDLEAKLGRILRPKSIGRPRKSR